MTRLHAERDIGSAALAREIRAVEAKGAALLATFRLAGWKVVVVYEEDDIDDKDGIRGSYGRCYFDEKLMWINGGYAGSPELVEDIIRYEIAHALLGGNAEHGSEFQEMAAHCGCTPAANRGDGPLKRPSTLRSKNPDARGAANRLIFKPKNCGAQSSKYICLSKGSFPRTDPKHL